jgi:hypothetical protein
MDARFLLPISCVNAACPPIAARTSRCASVRDLHASALACSSARGSPALPRLRRAPVLAISPRRGARSLRADAEMCADLPPGRAGVICFRCCAIARHTGGDCPRHGRDRLSTAREARLRPLPQCLGERCAVAFPAGDELKPRDDLLASQPERRRDLVSAAAGGVHRRQALLSLFRPGSRHRRSRLSDARFRHAKQYHR